MTKDTIVSVLESEGLKGGTKGFELPDGRELDCFIRSSADLLTVGKVARLLLQDKYICLENRKNERFFFAYEDVVGLRIGTGESAKEKSAGFFR